MRWSWPSLRVWTQTEAWFNKKKATAKYIHLVCLFCKFTGVTSQHLHQFSFTSVRKQISVHKKNAPSPPKDSPFMSWIAESHRTYFEAGIENQLSVFVSGFVATFSQRSSIISFNDKHLLSITARALTWFVSTRRSGCQTVSPSRTPARSRPGFSFSPSCPDLPARLPACLRAGSAQVLCEPPSRHDWLRPA